MQIELRNGDPDTAPGGAWRVECCRDSVREKLIARLRATIICPVCGCRLECGYETLMADTSSAVVRWADSLARLVRVDRVQIGSFFGKPCCSNHGEFTIVFPDYKECLRQIADMEANPAAYLVK